MAEQKKISVTKIVAITFAIVITVGTLLLMLPISNRSGQSIPLLNALFTATSATCVTGLVVYDTWTQFTYFGQAVILLLIQIGGLGLVTFICAFPLLFKRRISLKERTYLMENVNGAQLGGIVRLTSRILIMTLICEGIGAVLLSTVFVPMFGAKGIWFGVFHAVSAFCNAGFDLMGIVAPYSSLTMFVDNPTVNITIMALIIMGGLGFIVWNEIVENGFKIKKYSLHSKIMISATFIIIAVTSLAFFLAERDQSLEGLSTSGKIFASLFQVVTPRTAGFNTLDTASLSNFGKMLTLLLMIIGAGPGSTGGGIKVTTFVVILLSIRSYIKKQEDVNVFNRRITDESVRKAYNGATFYVILGFLGCILLATTQEFSLFDGTFEAFSAIGTVGLSTGITRELYPISKMIIILLMYCGRVGSLTVFMSLLRRNESSTLKNPVGKIIV